MVISASRDHSLAGPFHVSGLSPVRLVHPTGESHVNQPNGAFLRGYTAGGPRCHECRQADGQAAMPRQADTATLGSLDRNASIAVRHFLQRVRGLPGQEIVVSRQRKPPLRFGRHRRWLATPDPWVFLGNSGEFDFRVIQAQVIFSAKDFSSSDPPAITERRVWISMSEDPIVAIDIRYGQRYEHLKPISYSRHSETIGPVGNRLSVREGSSAQMRSCELTYRQLCRSTLEIGGRGRGFLKPKMKLRQQALGYIKHSTPTRQQLSALARKFADVFGLGGLGGGLVESLGEVVEIGAGELPLEWLGDLLVAAAERE
jgi:hypothetical protein